MSDLQASVGFGLSWIVSIVLLLLLALRRQYASASGRLLFLLFALHFTNASIYFAYLIVPNANMCMIFHTTQNIVQQATTFVLFGMYAKKLVKKSVLVEVGIVGVSMVVAVLVALIIAMISRNVTCQDDIRVPIVLLVPVLVVSACIPMLLVYLYRTKQKRILMIRILLVRFFTRVLIVICNRY